MEQGQALTVRISVLLAITVRRTQARLDLVRLMNRIYAHLDSIVLLDPRHLNGVAVAVMEKPQG